MIYLLLTDGFEEIEALTPVDVLRRCGALVSTVGVHGMEVMGAHNIKVSCDLPIDQVKPEEMEMLILPGGPGHASLKTDKVFELINYAVAHNITVGAICAAPSILGEMGLLDGKNATCFPGFEGSLKGATLQDSKVVKDDIFVTAKGAGAASEFAFVLAEIICGISKAEEIKNAMQY